MSTLPRFGSSTRLNSFVTLDTSQAAKASAGHRSHGSESTPQTTRSAPAERSKYQLWPALDQGIPRPLPGALEPATVPTVDRNRSVRVHQSADQMWLVYGRGGGLHPSQSKHSSKRSQALPKNVRRAALGIANITNTTCTNRRSCSAPGRTHQQDTLKEHEDVGMEYYETTSPPQQDFEGEALTKEERTKSLKRASSVLLPAELNDFVLSRLQREEFDADCRKVEAPCGQSRSKEKSGNEIPPAVPPKTLPKNEAPNLHVSPLKLRPTKGPACDKALPQIGPAETTLSPRSDSPKGQGKSNHVREGSGDSVMDRGRPSKRTRSPTKKGIMGSGNPSSDDLTCDNLPKGLPANTASTSLSREDLRRLGHQARSQATRFEVLQVKDVKALSQQVRLLDEQCEYLRGFAKSLRRNRRTLHAQTISYFKSPALSEIPRQSMLQKVETLADLDETIDEWAKKLERAEDQRLRTRQRLLEHIAAVLAIPSVIDTKQATNGGLEMSREQTPPQSPESLKSPPMTAGYDAESIRIYAGSEMHALLGVLNRETLPRSGTKNAG